MKKYQAQTQSQMRKWTMKSPLFETKGEAREWSLKVFKNAYISLYSEGQKVGVIEKFSFNALGMIRKVA